MHSCARKGKDNIMKRLISLAAAILILTCLGVSACAEYEPDTNYMSQMIVAAQNGDMEAGREAARLRNMKIERMSLLGVQYIDFDDFYLVSKIIYAEAGSNWLSNEHQRLVGSVLLNRVDSPEFPDTVEECIYQPGQYYSADSEYFQDLRPTERAATNAAIIMDGYRRCPSSVVFQANFEQGSGVYQAIDGDPLGFTYFCYSYNMGYYEN